MKRTEGLSIVELLVGMAIFAVLLVAFSTAQVGNLRTTGRSQASTEAKAAVLARFEELSRAVLVVNLDPTLTSKYDKYAFLRYDDYCRTTPKSGAPAVDCASAEGTAVSWTIVSEAGTATTYADLVKGEGQLRITVSTVDAQGLPYSLTGRVSCYDIYPSPNTTAPQPCPDPEEPAGTTGGT